MGELVPQVGYVALPPEKYTANVERLTTGTSSAGAAPAATAPAAAQDSGGH